LEKPGESVGPFEAGAAFGVEVLDFLGDVGGSEALGEGAAGGGGKAGLREEAGESDEEPVAVNGRVPVEAAIEGGS
jgi:hypothetical protein